MDDVEVDVCGDISVCLDLGDGIFADGDAFLHTGQGFRHIINLRESYLLGGIRQRPRQTINPQTQMVTIQKAATSMARSSLFSSAPRESQILW